MRGQWQNSEHSIYLPKVRVFMQHMKAAIKIEQFLCLGAEASPSRDASQALGSNSPSEPGHEITR